MKSLKAWLKPVSLFVLISMLVGFVLVVTGVIPINASGGHWTITKWMLSFSMSRSVATYSSGIEAPSNLDEHSRILKGASHYHFGCAPCHGSPIWQKPRVAQQLIPRPPSLTAAASNWSSAELFYIVKHGIKFTGMPAFPSQHRDDEVWDVVAYLQAYSDMTESEYRQLIGDDIDQATDNVPQIVTQHCVATAALVVDAA